MDIETLQELEYMLNEDVERYEAIEHQLSSSVQGIARGKLEYAQRLLAHIQLMKGRQKVSSSA